MQSERQKYLRSIARDFRLPLEPQFYRRKFKALLQCEEQEHIRLLRENCNGTYRIARVSKEDHNFHLGSYYKDYFSIHGMSHRQILYASQASDSVSIKCSNSTVEAKIAYLNEHYDVNNDALYIATNSYNSRLINRLWLQFQRKGFKIEFNVKHSYFENLEKAIRNISDKTIQRIVPSNRDFVAGIDSEWIPRSQYYFHRLDRFQLRALKTMLFCDSYAPVLVPGPFGTGKTRLLSVASEYLITNAKNEKIPARILLCCHQQNSADLFMKDYFMKMSYFDGLVVRVTSQIHQRLGQPMNSSTCIVTSCEQFIEDYKAHYKSQNRIVIVTTYLTALRMYDSVGQKYFTHILIDEGAQAREPECIAPLGMAGDDTRIIIVGDSKQVSHVHVAVGPKLVVLGEDAQNNGLGVSLLERLHQQYEGNPTANKYYTVTLRNNYRCVPDILPLSSDLFYQSTLLSCSKARNIRKPPLEFICSSSSPSATVGCECRIQAEVIIQELRKLMFEEKIPSRRICVMSPSQRQISLINQEKKQNKLYGVKTLSTYQMQGQEFDVLILSAVESTYSSGMPFDPLKSLCHPAIFNTAITRARSSIIVVGNPVALKKGENALSAEPRGCWKKYISTCEASGTYRNAIVTQPEVLLPQPISTNTATRRQPYDDSTIRIRPGGISTVSCVGQQIRSKEDPGIHGVHHPVQSGKKAMETASKVKNTAGLVSNYKQPAVQYKIPSSETASLVKSPMESPKKSVNKQSKAETSDQYQSLVQEARALKVYKQPAVQSKNSPSEKTSIAKNTSKTLNELPSHKGNAGGSSTISQPLEHMNGGRVSKAKKKRMRKKARDSIKPSFMGKDYSEEFPSIESSKNVSQKDIEKQKQRSEVTVERKQCFKHEHRKLNQELLEEKLTRRNYREKFHQLLCREEDEHERILKDRCDGVYQLHLDDHSHKICVDNNYKAIRDADDRYIRFGYITADHLDGDKVAYAEQASEHRLLVEIVTARGKQELELDMICSFHYNEQSKIVLGFEEFHYSYFGRIYEKANVTFILKYSYFDRQHNALDCLSDEVLKKLLPESPDDFGVLPRPRLGTYMCPEVRPYVWLDDKEKSKNTPAPQMFSLQAILKSDPLKAPVLVVGSFGTGKTRLLARAAYQILQNYPYAKVLVCAHHQKSVDAFIDNYFGKMMENDWFLGDGVMPIRLIPNAKTYRISNESYRKYYKKGFEVRQLDKRDLKLVITTYSSCNQLKFLKKWHFTHLLLDEGAQTREPETIIPLSLVNEKTTIVIAGDHKQVGPSILVLGEKPRKHGLKYSLLERLHSLYNYEDRLRDASEPHCATLLTNFRSHHALLSLPSYLFYESALVTVAQASNQLHPGAPHPLKFICSSLDDSVLEVNDSTNSLEVDLILKEVDQYIQKWPSKKLEELDLCIMATTPNQKSLFITKVKKYKNVRNNVEILTVYDIQGREFQAIFLSTAEPITKDGRSKNPTKSPCGQYVFNTAITRARSHVICVGNPFLLMKVEKTMENVDNEKSFWKDYFRRCIITKSFTVTSDIGDCSNLEKLQEMVFENESETYCAPKSNLPPQDSIMNKLEDVVAKRNNVKKCKIQIREQNREYYSANWALELQDSDTQSSDHTYDNADDSREKIVCELEIKSSRRGIAVPQNSPQESIVINGYHNRQGAFNGDVVEIALIGCDEEGTKYGKVTQVKEHNHPMKYVCTADNKDVIFFYPIDKRVPSIVNLPKLSRFILRYKPEELNELQKEYIAVFDESSLDDEVLSLKIKELVPLGLGPSLLFVVKVLSWSPKYRKPLGAVIEALPRTNNLFITQKLLSIAHDITLDEVSFTPDEPPTIASTGEYRNALTIDPEEAHNFDDAITVLPLNEPNTCELAVLIIDVTEYVKKGSDLDLIAEQKGTSVYPGHRTTGYRMIPMLPSSYTEHSLSLRDKGGVKPVLVVSAKVKIDEFGDTIDIGSSCVKTSTLEDPVNLTYHSAQLVLNDDELANSEQLLMEKVTKFNCRNPRFTLKKTLDLLFKIAMKLRIDRLSDAAYNYRISDPEDESSWQAHLLVEELMIWANSEVAKYVINERPDIGIVRRQPPPLTNDQMDFCNTYGRFLSFSLSHKGMLTSEDPVTVSGLLLTSDIVEKLRLAYVSGKTRDFVRILSQELNFSQLSIVENALISISQRARYTFVNPTFDDVHVHAEQYKHYSIGQLYTQFTSPIRRYVDMIVHRIAKALLRKEEMPYKEEEIVKLCRDLNIKTRNSKQYSKNIDRACSVSEWEDEGMKKVVGYVTMSIFRKQSFYLCFKDGLINEIMMRDDSTFDFSHLNYHKRDKDMLTWQVVTVPLCNSDYLTKCPSLAICHSPSNGQMLVKLYPPLTTAKDDSDRKCLKEHTLAIVDNNRVIPLEQWQLAQKCVKSASDQDIEAFYKSSLCNEVTSTDNSAAIKDSKSFNDDASKSPLIQYSVTAKFDIGYPVNVWIGKSTREALTSPSLHMIEVAPTVRICLMHVQDPSSCFSSRRLGQLSLVNDNLVEYVDMWCNALLAEACHDCVKTNKITILKDADVNWPDLKKSDTSIDKVYYTPKTSPFLEICLKTHDMMDFISISVGDLVCARYETPQGNHEVYHFYVSKIEETEIDKTDKPAKMIIYFDSYGEQGCKVSQKMVSLLDRKKSILRCDLQLIKSSISFHRVFQRLQCLKREYNTHKRSPPTDQKQQTWTDLAKAVASEQFRKIQCVPVSKDEYLKVLKEDDWAKCLWTEKKEMLNKKQIEAIESALEHKYQLIQGPPGTGKSITGAHLAYIFAIANRNIKRQSVLYCGPSNKAVDVVHYQLIKVNEKLNESKKLKILRLYGRTHETKDYPNPILEVTGLDYEDKVDSMCPDDLKPYALHHEIRRKNIELMQLEKELLSMKCDKKIPSLFERKKYNELLMKCEAKELQNSYDIILCTCNETCSNRIAKACSKKDTGSKKDMSSEQLVIGQCIVDECGMAHEPETIAAISRCDHAVLIGDHMQLQPVVKHSPAKACGLSRSLFQRYAESGQCLITLEIQYRMHESICEAPSNMFYDGVLQTDYSVINRGQLGRIDDFFNTKTGSRSKHPIRFYDIEGEEKSGMADDSVPYKTNVDVHSKFNIKEAEKAVELIQQIQTFVGGTQTSIAVLTPYSAQKDLIKERLMEKKLKEVKVLSIVETQGDEYDIVIISTVRTLPRKQIRKKEYVQPDRKWRTENLGFLIDSHQLNVAITRAKHGLIIIGNRMLLEYDEDGWGKLIKKYDENGLIVRQD